MKRIVFDTNIFLRLLLNDIPEHTEIIEKYIIAAKEHKITIMVPQIVVFEMEFVLRKYYLLSKEDINEKLIALISSPYFHVQDAKLFKKAISLYMRNTVSFSDCFIISYTGEEKATLLTFDKKLKQIQNETLP